MRILFTVIGGPGHLHPLLPVAQAAQRAGHTVAFLTGGRNAPAVERAGFTALPTGPARERNRERTPLLVPDRERERDDVRNGFIRRGATARAESAARIVPEWRPDLLVCEEMDWGTIVVAERLGLPYAEVVVLAAGSFLTPEVIAEPLHELRAAQGLPPDPDLAMIGRYLVLAPVPPSFSDPAVPAPPTRHAIRPSLPHPRGARPWPAALPDAPTVYATLGTEFNVECGDLFARVLAGVGALPVNVVGTTGSDVDPAEFGPQPPNVHLARYLPQADLLPWCDLVLSHAGSGSVLGAIAHGLPQVLLPMGADQLDNGDRCAALGLGRVLDPVGATPDEIGAAVREVLAAPSHRAAAGALRDEALALPSPEHAVTLLETLASTRDAVLA